MLIKENVLINKLPQPVEICVRFIHSFFFFSFPKVTISFFFSFSLIFSLRLINMTLTYILNPTDSDWITWVKKGSNEAVTSPV